ncbi:MAG: polyphosphate kinase 1 [Tannerellaceae bacterium]|nr:polyphosphate kinase 1 [Tannerellaceae bacterium]
MPENAYQYFKRDISWLSFNYRVLLEAGDETLPLYERIRFLAIYASNLEEFYEIRVAEHRGVILKRKWNEESCREAEETLAEITLEVNRQQEVFYRIFSEQILEGLNRQRICLYRDAQPRAFHAEFVRSFFNEEVFPFLSPVRMETGAIRTFLRDRRLYLVVRMQRKEAERVSPAFHYALIKIPFAKTPRFVELPRHKGVSYIMFIDDVIRANLAEVFPGYVIESCYSIKISRNADIYIENEAGNLLVETLRNQVKKRKIGHLCRFMYDGAMPQDFLDFVCRAFDIRGEDLVVGGRYLNLSDLARLPRPQGQSLGWESLPVSLGRRPFPEEDEPMFRAVRNKDRLLHFPYHSFDALIRLLAEAAREEEVEEIKITQYRVAENSAIIHTLVEAAQRGKKVTVFVELKARFDEEHNLATAEYMKQAGIRILYGIPGLKVHAKLALILCRGGQRLGCLSTGNFNEKTARTYSDMALLTAHRELTEEIGRVFLLLEGSCPRPVFHRLLVARFNMAEELRRRIRGEIARVEAGGRGRIILKMNGLQDREMIDELYRAGEAGVRIDLIVRGVCCLIPNQPYSPNISITRLVDVFLEHARLWYFYNEGAEDVFLSSADWMPRNLSRRIETAAPILDAEIKQTLIRILEIQLQDNTKACFLDEHLNNCFKHDDNPTKIRSQLLF